MSKAHAIKPLERRYNQRLLLNELCTLHFPELFSPVKATRLDLD